MPVIAPSGMMRVPCAGFMQYAMTSPSASPMLLIVVGSTGRSLQTKAQARAHVSSAVGFRREREEKREAARADAPMIEFWTIVQQSELGPSVVLLQRLYPDWYPRV